MEVAGKLFASLSDELATYAATPEDLSPEAPEGYGALLGDYGWDHSGIRILEKDGQLHVLMEWFTLYPLEQVGPDAFKLNRMTAYNDEVLTFERTEVGVIRSLVIGGSARLPRRAGPGDTARSGYEDPVMPGDARSGDTRVHCRVRDRLGCDLDDVVSWLGTGGNDVRIARRTGRVEQR